VNKRNIRKKVKEREGEERKTIKKKVYEKM
jgi:hypothetical protein